MARVMDMGRVAVGRPETPVVRPGTLGVRLETLGVRLEILGVRLETLAVLAGRRRETRAITMTGTRVTKGIGIRGTRATGIRETRGTGTPDLAIPVLVTGTGAVVGHRGAMARGRGAGDRRRDRRSSGWRRRHGARRLRRSIIGATPCIRCGIQDSWHGVSGSSASGLRCNPSVVAV